MSSSINKYQLNNYPRQPIDPWFLSTPPPSKKEAKAFGGAELRSVTPAHLDFLKTTAWVDLPSPFGQLYSEFQIYNPYPDRSLEEAAMVFWQALPNAAVVQGVLNTFGNNSRKFQRAVYVSKEAGSHFGSFSWRLMQRASAVNSLLIQTFGIRNLVPCDCCARNFQKFVGTKPGQVRSMMPYYDCVSLPQSFHNRCGNCMFLEAKNEKCDFQENEGHWGHADPSGGPDQRSLTDPAHRRHLSGGGLPSLAPPNDLLSGAVNYFRLHDFRDYANALITVPGLSEWTGGAVSVLETSGWLDVERRKMRSAVVPFRNEVSVPPSTIETSEWLSNASRASSVAAQSTVRGAPPQSSVRSSSWYGFNDEEVGEDGGGTSFW